MKLSWFLASVFALVAFQWGHATASSFEFSEDGVIYYIERGPVTLAPVSENLPLETALWTMGLGRKPQAPLYFYALPLVQLETVSVEKRDKVLAFISHISRSHRVARIELLDQVFAEARLTEELFGARGRSFDLAWVGMAEHRMRGIEIDAAQVYRSLKRLLNIDSSQIEGESGYLFFGLNLSLPAQFDEFFLDGAVLVELNRN